MAKSTADIAAPINEGLEKAATAVRTFITMCPELSIFANILLGKDPHGRGAVSVQPGPSTCTDGRIIYIRPDARLVGTVSEAEWSDIKASMFHEVAHIAFDSFAKISDTDRSAAIWHLTETLTDSLRRDAILDHLRSADANYKSLSLAFHGLMPMLVNALEDARVEYLLFAAKPGTQKHLERQRMEIFDAPKAEIEARIGKAWADRDDDSQVIIGCYLLGAGYAVEKRLGDIVAVDLRAVEPLVLAAVQSDSVGDVYARAFAVLTAFQERGYLRNGDERDADIGKTEHQEIKPDTPMKRAEDAGCPHPKSKIVPCDGAHCRGNCMQCGAHIISLPSSESPSSPPGPESERSPGDTGETTGEQSDGPVTEGMPEQDGETYQSERETGGQPIDSGEELEGARSVAEADVEEIPATERTLPEPDGSEVHDALHQAGGHDHDDSEDDDDDGLSSLDISDAVKLIEHGYAPGEQPALGVCTINVGTRLFGSGISRRRREVTPDAVLVERAVAQVMPELRQALALNGMTGFTGGLRSGRVDTRALTRTAIGDPRIFGRFQTAETRSYQFVLALDCSGSMSPDPGGGQHLSQKHTSLAAMHMLDRLGVPFCAFGYSGNDYGRGYSLDISWVRENGEPWDAAAVNRLMKLEGYRANLDGSTMQYARIQGRKAVRDPRTEVVVLYFNDGGMPAENPVQEAKLIAWEVANQRRNKVHYIGVGVGSTAVLDVGLELVPCNDPVSGALNITRKIAQVLGVS